MLTTLAQAQTPVEQEYNDLELGVSGTLPPTLNGVLFRNGPGRFERGGVPYGHAFDGDGHICRFEFNNGRVYYRNRFVRTRAYLAEERAGRMLWRGFGTQKPGGLPANLLRLRFKNAANTSIIAHAGRLLALWEGGAPHRLDPVKLATLGEEDFDGQLRNRFDPLSRWTSPLLPFSAHPSIDAVTGELINFGLVLGRPSRLILYRIDAEGRMASPAVHQLDRFSFVHQIAATDRWICVLLPYADFDIPRALLGLRSPAASLKLDTERPMQALLIPRDGGATRLIETEVPGFVFHIAQALDTEDGGLSLHVVRYPSFPALGDFEQFFSEVERSDGLPRLEQLYIHPNGNRCTLSRCSETAFELPTSAPGRIGAQRRHLYGIATPPERRLPFFSALSRFEIDTGELTQRDLGHDLPGEPIPTASKADSEDWLLALVYRSAEHRSDLLVLNASDLSTQATIHLPHSVPLGFHGCWVPESSAA
ncbi:MAG: lignostilbene alpha-beta-dioxygenase [Gammaproteobacteria bacterium]|jgi:all-trans-8'-apo-beta-carotenal 15,15'-oxygenase|nr:lignostilbene alpha-beta-dioxygenase [Gammaproteobacteria bacterium]